MKRFLTAILVTGIAATVLTGCQSAPEKSESSTTKSDEGLRVGNEIPEAFKDYGQTKSAEELQKATGYEYDKEKLEYELVWEDNFDGDALDDSKWEYEVGTGQWGWGNNEIQYYTKGDNCTVKDGLLTIELRKDKSEDGSERVTSTRIVTRDHAQWKYGKIEMRAKLPSGKGTWPAFWMMPVESAYGTWPASGEIDIMEFVGYQPDMVHHTVHNKAFNGAQGSQKGTSYVREGISDDFHTYAVEWLPDKMIFSSDGEEVFTYDPHEWTTMVTSDQWPYDKEFYVILNLAWGGNWGGAMGIDESCLPQQYQIDYVRVYQSPQITALTADEE